MTDMTIDKQRTTGKHQLDALFLLDHPAYEHSFLWLLDRIAFSEYARPIYLDSSPHEDPDEPLITFRNGTFILRQFDWHHDIEQGPFPTNFEHIPTGLTVSWYKYAFRSAESNQAVSTDEFHTIIKDCVASIPDRFESGRPRPDITGVITRISQERTESGLFSGLTLKTDSGDTIDIAISPMLINEAQYDDDGDRHRIIEIGNKVSAVTAHTDPTFGGCSLVRLADFYY